MNESEMMEKSELSSRKVSVAMGRDRRNRGNGEHGMSIGESGKGWVKGGEGIGDGCDGLHGMDQCLKRNSAYG